MPGRATDPDSKQTHGAGARAALPSVLSARRLERTPARPGQRVDAALSARWRAERLADALDPCLQRRPGDGLLDPMRALGVNIDASPRSYAAAYRRFLPTLAEDIVGAPAGLRSIVAAAVAPAAPYRTLLAEIALSQVGAPCSDDELHSSARTYFLADAEAARSAERDWLRAHLVLSPAMPGDSWWAEVWAQAEQRAEVRQRAALSLAGRSAVLAGLPEGHPTLPALIDALAAGMRL